MNIGIEKHTGLMYEAEVIHGYGITPTPTLLMASIVEAGQDQYQPPKAKNFDPGSIIFREDTYNSSSRIRKGRIYKAWDSQPQTWHVAPHTLANEKNVEFLRKEVYAFSPFRVRVYLREHNISDPIFILGSETGFTIWSLIHVETTATGEELVILRARKSIGALPHILEGEIPEVGRQRVLSFLGILSEDIYSAGPESVVDRSREAAAAILSTFLQAEYDKQPGKDLKKLADLAAKHGLTVVANLAHTIARFHARTKNAVQENHGTRPITEQDAELSVQAVGTILCDLGWGTWKFK